MGAHQSHAVDGKWRDARSTMSSRHQYAGHLSTKNGITNGQGKPSPPNGIPTVSDVTHNSLSLSWQPPKVANGSIIAYMVEMRVTTDKDWITLTRSCQGISYKVRNLEADSSYQFRVRAENIFGRSKSGNVSEIVQTSSFDVHDFAPCKERQMNVTRRSSLNTQVPVEGRVAAILNHSSPVIETMSVRSAEESRGSLLQRDGARLSLTGQTIMKRSGSSLIPGTRTNCLTKLRSSQSKVQHFESKKNRNSLGNSLEKIYLNGDSDSRSDIGSECNTVSQSSGSDYLLQDRNANERCSPVDDSVDGDGRLSDDVVVMAPDCGGLKRNGCHTCVSYSDERLHFVRDEGIETSGPTNPDFRTLRSMLQSSDVIIKPTLSLPEISDVCRGKSGRVSLRHKLSTIVDEDDDDDVRVTTL